MTKKESNLPAKRTLDEILASDEADLSPVELQYKKAYSQELEREESETSGYVARPLRLEVASSQQLFKLPGGTASSKVKGVIIGSLVARGNWHKENEGDEGILCCSSVGGRTGQPTEEGKRLFEYLRGDQPLCHICLANMWGTGAEGKGKKCKEMRILLFWHPSCKSALRLSIPPTSIWAYDDFRSKARAAGKTVIAHFTEIELMPAGKKPVVWSLFKFSLAEPIPMADLPVAKELRERFKESLGIIEDEDYRLKPQSTDDDPGIKPQETPDPDPEWERTDGKDELPF